MFYKKKGKPQADDIVICTVKKILYHSIFVSIDEYENLEGMIHISEIAPGRIRNLRDYVIEGKKIICKVLNVNPQGNIDLSLRRVPVTVMVNRLNEFKQEEKAEKLFEQVGKEFKLDLKKIYESMGLSIIEKYGGLYAFLQAISEKGKNLIDEFKPNPKFADALYNIVKEKIKPIEVSISGTLNLRSYNNNGIDDIKSILLKIKEQKVNVHYLGAPKYKLSIVAKNYKTAESIMKNAVDSTLNLGKKLGCEISFLKNE